MDTGFGYGGLDAMGGGGFVQEGGVGSGNGQEKKGTKEKGVIMPLTIRQILSSGEQVDIMVDGNAVSQCCIVGTVEKQERTSTKTVYVVSDGTGAIKAESWTNKPGDGAEEQYVQIPDFALVRIFGAVKWMPGAGHLISVYHIQPVQDWNEMTHHFLSTVLTHLQHTKGAIPGSSMAKQSATFGMGAGTGMGMVPNTNGVSLNAAMGAAGASGQREEVRNFYLDFKGRDPEGQGASFSLALKTLQDKGVQITEKQLKDHVAALTEDGEMYTTSDDAHYALC